MKIAIIGAGLTGLRLAALLSEAHQVSVFEKARGPGGRMSTRRAEPYAFDHGAQYFTAETIEFQTFVGALERAGIVARWPAEIVLRNGARVSSKPKYAAQPGMNAICKSLASGLVIETGLQVQSMSHVSGQWQVRSRDDQDCGTFDWVISTAPAEQTAQILPADFAARAELGQVRMQACFSLMLGFESSIALPWQALKSGSGPVGWMAVNSLKPQRPQPFALLIQSGNDWADAHIEEDPSEIVRALLASASELAGTDLSGAAHQVLHRWRYAATAMPAGQPFLIDPAKQLAAAGDWCLGGKVEAAFSSASALADHILSLTKT